jgi:hypothetical protein
MSELSTSLCISRAEFHNFSYIITKILSNTNNGVEKMGKFLLSKGIISNDLDRIIRYNCISKDLELMFPSKKRTTIRKILNGKSIKKTTKQKPNSKGKGESKGNGKKTTR